MIKQTMTINYQSSFEETCSYQHSEIDIIVKGRDTVNDIEETKHYTFTGVNAEVTYDLLNDFIRLGLEEQYNIKLEPKAKGRSFKVSVLGMKDDPDYVPCVDSEYTIIVQALTKKEALARALKEAEEKYGSRLPRNGWFEVSNVRMVRKDEKA